MFHRRLLLMAAGTGVVMALVATRLGMLTLGEGDRMREIAESRLVRQTWTDTLRGRILDRKGRVLAAPAPHYDLALDYAVLSGEWASQQATRFAERVHGREWSAAAPADRDALVRRYQPAFEALVRDAWAAASAGTGMEVSLLQGRGEGIVRRVERMHEQIVRSRIQKAIAEEEAAGREVTPERQAAIERKASAKLAVQQAPHVLATASGDLAAFELKSRVAERVTIRPGAAFGIDREVEVPRLPGLSVVAGEGRTYPMESVVVGVDRRTLIGPLRGEGVVEIEVEGLATHVLGWVRRGATQEHQEARRAWLSEHAAEAERAREGAGRDRGEYESDDDVGVSGIEAAMEHRLRGLRGVTQRRLDTGETSSVAPQPGRDVTLTIDAMLQARVHAAMTPELGLAVVQDWHGPATVWMPVGTPLNGAAVVLDIESGDVLAMVTTPSFTRAHLRDDPASIFNDELEAPWVNRTLAKPYPPGSIAKAIVYAAAVSRGVLGPTECIECTGHLLPGRPDDYECWIWKRYRVTHQEEFGHALSGPEALMASCNTFFYTLGRRLGGKGIEAVYRDFGLGETFGFGIGGGEEFAGWTGRLDPPGAPITTPDAILMGIGQGPVAWTPMHAARALATLARFGVDLPPRLVMEPEMVRRPRWVSLDAGAVREALTGLKLSVSDARGTGHHITMESGDREVIFTPPAGVQVWGKTGTAQAPDLMVDPDGEGPMPANVGRRGDHSWFVVFAGREKPKYVIAVMMEYAGSGGKVSGPIVNQIIQALDAEGYF